MKKYLFLFMILMVFSSHDLFLKMDSYFLAPNESSTLKLYNGTFQKSENVIDRNRMLDVSLVANGQHARLDTSQWSEKDSVTILSFDTKEAGTYVAGVSTRARNIELSAEDFNNYLEHDGVIDMLNWRKENNALESDAVEKYSKHVKAIFQVGEKRTDDWKVNLGYPIEFIPLNNPYDLHTGDQLSVQLLRAGEPLTDQLVYVDSEISPFGHTHDEETTHSHSDETHSHDESNKADHDHDADDHAHDHGNGHVHETGNEHSHAHEKEPTDSHSHSHEHDENGNHVHNEDEEHSHNEGIQLRTNADGVVSFKLASDGIWYMRTIHLVPIEEEGLTHESNWATLTFEVRHDHGPSVADHVHESDDVLGIPGYVYWLGSAAIIGILFFWFYRKGE